MTRAVLFFLLGCAAFYFPFLTGQMYERGVWESRQADAVRKAVAIEREQQEAVNDELKKQNADLVGIIGVRDAAIAKLQQRPSRVRTIIYPGPPCPGGTGAELFREDGEFLTREAARADSIRVGLRTCYAAYDKVRALLNE